MAIPWNIYLELDKPDETYTPGQGLKGVVVVELENALDILGIELKISGATFVKWSEIKTDQHEKTEIQHTAEEIYFEDVFILWGQGRCERISEKEVLSPGRHMFPFHVTIPRDLPSSFEGSHGWVRYTAQTVVIRPNGTVPNSSQLTAKRIFSVLSESNLNREPNPRKGVSEHKECMMRSNCCKAGQINCSIFVPRPCCVPGEKIQAEVDIHNLSNRKVKGTSLALVQIITYRTSDSKSRQERFEVGRVQGDCVKAGRRQCWTSRAIKIPPLVPSQLSRCKYIDIEYKMVLNLEVHTSPTSISVPITIGNVPLSDSLLTTWILKPQYIPSSRKYRASLVPAGSSHFLEEDQRDFLPKVKVFTPQSPMTTMMTFECSPGQKRKKVVFLSEQANASESNV